MVVINKLNVTRKVDSNGRIYIPAALKEKARIPSDGEVGFYYIQETDGMQREFIGIGGANTTARLNENNKYETAISALQELGLPVPKELYEKYKDTVMTEEEKLNEKILKKNDLSPERKMVRQAFRVKEKGIEEVEEKVKVAPSRD